MAQRESNAAGSSGKLGRGPLPPLPEDRRPPRARAPRRPSSAQAEKSRGQEPRPREIVRALSLPPLQSQREKAAKAPDRERSSRKPSPVEPSSARPAKGASSSTRTFQAEMEEWRRRNGVPAEAKVFSITGAFPGIRKALVARGWHENEDRQSQCWDLRYALWQRDLGEMNELDDGQVVNYFARNAELTSKVGLCNSLYNCCTLDRVDVNSFYPRCYDLTTPAQAEHFVEDFKLTWCRCLLRRFVELGGLCAPDGIAWKALPREVVQAALGVCRRQARSVDDSLDEALEPAILDDEWTIVKFWSLKTPGKRLEAMGAPKAKSSEPPQEATQEACADDVDLEEDAALEPTQDCAGHVDEALLAEVLYVLEELKRQLPQFGMDGHQNIWVLKPAGKSRGRGIQLSARLEKIQQVALGRGAEARWIAQKYIENPLVVNGKKFDIRQWVLVTRWSPLAAWFYQDCYVRFSFADYDPRKLKNKYAHLTNNSISKKAEGFEEEKDETMWHSDEFQEYLANLGFQRNGEPVEDPWLEIVQPAMKFAVLRSLEAAQDSVVHRASSFELFGYDFMVDQDLKVWLIEVNSSPDLSYSTSTTRQMVKSMIEDMMAVVVDVEKFGSRLDRPKKKWNTCRLKSGRFELLEPARRRREEKFPKLRKDAQYLAVQGSGIKLRKPRKGECPRGPDAEEDPQYSATALLAAAAEEVGGELLASEEARDADPDDDAEEDESEEGD